MKWAFSIRQKTKAALLLLIVFVLILAKNILDGNNIGMLIQVLIFSSKSLFANTPQRPSLN